MKLKKIIKTIFRLIALLFLCAGFTLAVIEYNSIWTFTIAAGLAYGMAQLIS